MAAGSLEVVGHACPHSADSEFDRVDRTVLRTQANARDDGTLNRIISALNRIIRALNRIVRALDRNICPLNRIIRTGAWTAGLPRFGLGSASIRSRTGPVTPRVHLEGRRVWVLHDRCPSYARCPLH